MLLISLLILTCIGLMSGFPVAFALAGSSLIIATIGHILGVFDLELLSALPNRIYGIVGNELLLAVPLFVFMGIMLQRAKIAESLLENMAQLFGNMRSGLALSVMLVGTLLGASTGIVGATVVTMGLLSLPTMLKTGYDKSLACGTICTAGTLGQIIPPSIVLLLLADQISSANQTAQLALGNMTFEPVSIADIFMGALSAGIILVVLYLIWLVVYSKLSPKTMPALKKHAHVSTRALILSLVPPLSLIIIVLGSILAGLTTATESAAIGAFGSIVLAYLYKQLSYTTLKEVVRETTKTTSMVFTVLIGATFFTLVFRGLEGDHLIHQFLTDLPGGLFTVMLITMILIFCLGFFLDFIEIIFVVVPIVAPILLTMGADPIWLAVMIAVNLQTSFLTPPFGFALFYLRGVAPKKIPTSAIYRGVIPFIIIQLMMLGILGAFPKLATYLPEALRDTSTQPNIILDDFSNDDDMVDY